MAVLWNTCQRLLQFKENRTRTLRCDKMINFAVTLKSYKEEMTEWPQKYEICWNSGNMGYFQKAGAGGVLEKYILKNFEKLIGKDLCWSPFFNTVADLRRITLLQKRLQHRFFPVTFAKFSRQYIVLTTTR